MIHVSDHAVLRYVELVLGVDVEAIRAELSSPAFVAAAEFGAREVEE